MFFKNRRCEETYIRSEMADTSLQEVVFDRPFHQAVVNRGPANSLIVLDGLVVVALEGSQISDLQVMFVRKTAILSVTIHNHTIT